MTNDNNDSDNDLEDEFEFLDDDDEPENETSTDSDNAEDFALEEQSAYDQPATSKPKILEQVKQHKNKLFATLAVAIVGFIGISSYMGYKSLANGNGNSSGKLKAADHTDFAIDSHKHKRDNPYQQLQDSLLDKTSDNAKLAAAGSNDQENNQKEKTDYSATTVDQSTNINKTIDSITEEITTQVNALNQIEDILGKLVVSVNKINSSIYAIDNRISDLTEAVNGVTQDFATVKKFMHEDELFTLDMQNITPESKKANGNKTLTYQAPEYIVHAIIPGRAWLKASSGKIITVTEGDTIGDYGKIAVIDAANNLVRTSSGVTFR